MSIIYLCPTGTYSSLIAANLHTGIININSSINDLLQLPNFGHYKNIVGMFICVGKDEGGRIVYTLGTGNESELIIKSAQDLLQINNIRKNILFVDVSKYIPKQLVWCNKLAALKLKRTLPQLDSLVLEVKQELE